MCNSNFFGYFCTQSHLVGAGPESRWVPAGNSSEHSCDILSNKKCCNFLLKFMKK